MATESDYNIDDILTTEELESLGSPEDSWDMPDAQVFEWDDEVAVATPGFSIASSMDRFAGPMNRPHFQALEGFNSQFTDNSRRAVIAGEDLRTLVGEKAVARIQGFDESYAVDVRSPDEVLEIIQDYDENYSGQVEEEFWSKLENNNAVLPVIYSTEGVIPQTGIALMEGEGVMTSSDETPTGLMNEVDHSTVDHNVQVDRYEAPEAAEAEYFVDVMLPPEYDDVNHALVEQGLVIDVDGEKTIENFSGERDIHSYSENNGVYTVELT